jgi:hypothetical protein
MAMLTDLTIHPTFDQAKKKIQNFNHNFSLKTFDFGFFDDIFDDFTQYFFISFSS